MTVARQKPQATCPNCGRKLKADLMWGVYADVKMRRMVRHKRELPTGQLGDWCEPRQAWRVR